VSSISPRSCRAPKTARCRNSSCASGDRVPGPGTGKRLVTCSKGVEAIRKVAYYRHSRGGKMKPRICLTAGIAAAIAATGALADITIGVSIGFTGPQASLGVHYKNAFDLLPKTLAGEPVRYIILDNASDVTNAARNGRKLVTEDKVDVLMGSNGVPQTLALAQIASESKTPMLAFSPINVPAENAHWTFVVPQPTELMMDAVARDIKKNN